MKNYIFLVLSLLVFVSCNQTSKSENEVKVEQDEEFNPLDYSDVQLDSMGRVSVDSALLFINQLSLQKDTSFMFSYAEIDFFVQKDRFESFYLLKNSVCLYDNAYLYLATNQNGKYQILDSLECYSLGWVENIYLEDVNFDTKKDIIIKYRNTSASRIVALYYLILQEDFKNETSLNAMDSLYRNLSRKEIIAFIDGGTFGPHEKNFYKWINDSLTLTKYWTTSFDVMATKTTEKFIIKKGESIRVNYDTMHVEESGMDSLWYVIED